MNMDEKSSWQMAKVTGTPVMEPASPQGLLIDACDGSGFIGGTFCQDPSMFFVDAEDEAMVQSMAGQSDRHSVDDDLLIMGAGSMDGGLGNLGADVQWDAFPPIPEHSELGPSGDFRLFMSGEGVKMMGHFQDVGPSMVNYDGPKVRLSPGRVPKVASMPNFVSLIDQNRDSDDQEEKKIPQLGISPPTLPPRSYSTNDLSSLGTTKYDVPHSQFLTAPHLRKGKGGRQPAQDPRMDPNIDPKKARRILANRLSAAKSKMKQKSAIDSVKQKIQNLEERKKRLVDHIAQLKEACSNEEAYKMRLLKGGDLSSLGNRHFERNELSQKGPILNDGLQKLGLVA
eukprot:jgi/Picsp_1/2067/NSC_05532-R1_hypothetical protein CHLNCDRAFT_137216 [Chlorella variabilis]